jgi:type II secretory pathway pseudopilin PulG
MLIRRKAFTVIELLLVVAVLVILIGIVVWGLKAAGGSASANATRTTLQNLTSMSEELNRKNKLAGFENPVPPPPPPLGTLYPVPSLNGGGETAPGLVTADSKNFDRLGAAVQRTAEVMRRLTAIPDLKKALEKFPSDQLLSVPPVAPYSGGTVVLDGWRNPIVFAPPSGLRNVASKTPDTWSGSTNYSRGARVISGGLYYTAIESNTGSNPPDDKIWFPGIRSPDGRAFWASAGADGTFGAPSDIKAGAGDDNIYSFEQ